MIMVCITRSSDLFALYVSLTDILPRDLFIIDKHYQHEEMLPVTLELWIIALKSRLGKR